MSVDAEGTVRSARDEFLRHRARPHGLRSITKVLLAVAVLTMVTVLSAFQPYEPHGGWHDGGDMWVDERSYMRLSRERTEAHRYEDSYRWTVEWNVTRITNGFSEQPPRWANGSLRFNFDARDEYPPPIPLVMGPPVGLDNVTFYYTELMGDPSGPDVGDVLGLSGLTRIHQRAGLEISADGFYASARLGYWNETLKVQLTPLNVSVQKMSVDGWNASTRIIAVEPAWERAPWEWLMIDTDHSTSQRYRGVVPLPENGSLANGIFFVESGVPDGLIGPGDEVRIVSIDRHWPGIRLRFMMGASSISYVDVPHLYPSTTLSIGLGEPTVTTRPSRRSPVFDVVVPIVSVEPTNAPIPWEWVYIMVGDDPYDVVFDCQPDIYMYDADMHAWYHEPGHPAGVISVGDTLHVSGLTSSEYQATARIVYMDQEMGSVRLPAIISGLNCTFWMGLDRPACRLDPDKDLWELSLVIRGTYPSHVRIPWSEIEVILADQNRTHVRTLDCIPAALVDTGSTALTASYDDGPATDNLIGNDDLLCIRGFDSSLEGGSINLSRNGEYLGCYVLPLDFTPTDLSKVTLTLLSPTINATYLGDPGTVYKLLVRIASVHPSDAVVPWAAVRINIYDGSGTLRPVNAQNLTPYEGDGNLWDYRSGQYWAWYAEVLEADFVDGNADYISVTGITSEFNGGRVDLLIGGRIIASATIPATMPV